MKIGRTITVWIFAMVLFAAIVGCSVNANKGTDEKGGKKVDIESPFGSLHVATNDKAKAEDTGLPVYPGARLAPEESASSDSQRANVSMGFAGFGLKVVAVKYDSDDPQEKVLDFYHKALGKYGKVVECKGDLDVEAGKDNKEMTCKPSGDSKTEIGVKEGSVSHIVSLRPQGKTTRFALIYLNLQGRNRETM